MSQYFKPSKKLPCQQFCCHFCHFVHISLPLWRHMEASGLSSWFCIWLKDFQLPTPIYITASCHFSNFFLQVDFSSNKTQVPVYTKNATFRKTHMTRKKKRAVTDGFIFHSWWNLSIHITVNHQFNGLMAMSVNAESLLTPNALKSMETEYLWLIY